MSIECIFCESTDVMLYKGVYCSCNTCNEGWVRIEVREGASEQDTLNEALETLGHNI